MSGFLRRAASGIGSAWDSTTDTVGGWADDAYHAATDWNFEGRDRRNGETPTLEEIQADDSWRLMGEKETLYHDNRQGAAEQKYVRNNDEGWGGQEAVFDGDTGQAMQDPRYKATYNYVNPAEGGMGDLSPEGIARNLGHLALDVVPYWFGGTTRGEEGTNMLERMVGPDNYQALGDTWTGATDAVGNGWDTATDWVGNTASDIGSGISNGWDTATDWVGDTASGIGDTVSSGWDSATDWAGDAASSAGDAVSSGWSSATDWAGSWFD